MRLSDPSPRRCGPRDPNVGKLGIARPALACPNNRSGGVIGGDARANPFGNPCERAAQHAAWIAWVFILSGGVRRFAGAAATRSAGVGESGP